MVIRTLGGRTGLISPRFGGIAGLGTTARAAEGPFDRTRNRDHGTHA